jgi:hypothetical protein
VPFDARAGAALPFGAACRQRLIAARMIPGHPTQDCCCHVCHSSSWLHHGAVAVYQVGQP